MSPASAAPSPALFALDQLVTEWTLATNADRARSVEAEGGLREALAMCDELSDYTGLPCPLGVFLAARNLAHAWLECGSNDVRRDRTFCAAEPAIALAYAYVTGSIDRPFRTGLRPSLLREAEG